jgi:hypothetical protein
MRRASLVLLVCAIFAPASAQENLSCPRSFPASPSAANLLSGTKQATRNGPVHPIPVHYGGGLHAIPLSQTSDHYVHEIPIYWQNQPSATSVITEKAHPANPHLQPLN